jgi:hypothetical protein
VTRVDDDDAAVVVALLTALAASTEPDAVPEQTRRSVWADPSHRLGLQSPSASGWWASGLPR